MALRGIYKNPGIVDNPVPRPSIWFVNIVPYLIDNTLALCLQRQNVIIT